MREHHCLGSQPSWTEPAAQVPARCISGEDRIRGRADPAQRSVDFRLQGLHVSTEKLIKETHLKVDPSSRAKGQAK